MFAIYRTVVLDEPAQKAVDAATAKFDRFDEAYDGLVWLLARRPKQGIAAPVNGTTYRLYVQAADNLAMTPEIWVVYTHDVEQVTIHGLAAV